jgi:ABC-type lipoprotein export system ATPase subunit
VGRVTSGAQNTAGSTVAEYAKDLEQRIQTTLSQYAARSQDLDRTFPSRLIAQDPAAGEPVEQLRARLAQLETQRERLTSFGFLDKEQTQDQPSSDALSRRHDVLTIFANDVEQKLATFNELAAKIEVLLRIINNRFDYKTLAIDRKSGFVITQLLTGTRLAPRDLSSGEQHELVMIYDLLFRQKEHSLVLIDEPELSLHVSWQQSFLGDIGEVLKKSDADVIIATHAPELIGSHWPIVETLQAPPSLEAAQHAARA